jgi:hypothetical protein
VKSKKQPQHDGKVIITQAALKRSYLWKVLQMEKKMALNVHGPSTGGANTETIRP